MLTFLFFFSMRWLSLRLDILAIVLNTVTALFVVLIKGHLPTAYAGLALAYSMQVILLILLNLSYPVYIQRTKIMPFHNLHHPVILS